MVYCGRMRRWSGEVERPLVPAGVAGVIALLVAAWITDGAAADSDYSVYWWVTVIAAGAASSILAAIGPWPVGRIALLSFSLVVYVAVGIAAVTSFGLPLLMAAAVAYYALARAGAPVPWRADARTFASGVGGAIVTALVLLVSIFLG